MAVPGRDFIPHVLHIEKCDRGGSVVVLTDKQRRGEFSLTSMNKYDKDEWGFNRRVKKG